MKHLQLISADNSDDDKDIDYIKNEIINRISVLSIICPECETIICSDEQYHCVTCGGSGKIYVLPWIKSQL
jgi:hypothetical protein